MRSENAPTVLVVDDKPNMLRLMTKVLRGVAHVYTATNGDDAVSILDSEVVDVVLCDLRMPDISGLEVLSASKARQPRARFILMTAYASVDTAITALKDGAFDYLTKPFEPEEAKATVIRALSSVRPRPAVAQGVELLPGVHARSTQMKELAAIVLQVAPTCISTLIGGESGTGKKTLARAIHRLSAFGVGAFFHLDCRNPPAGGMCETLNQLKPAAADGPNSPETFSGTLFVDEVDVLRAADQAALAHAVERFHSASTPSGQGVRLITSTQRDLDAMVANGSFRRDLFFLIRVASLTVPPLRMRREDIPVLAATLLSETEQATGEAGGFAAGAMERLSAAEWPGNVRELRSVIEHAAAHAGPDGIGLEALPEWIQDESASEARWETLSWSDAMARGRADIARRYLIALLRRFKGDVVRAASQASVERESFYRLLRRHGIQPEGFRKPAADQE